MKKPCQTHKNYNTTQKPKTPCENCWRAYIQTQDQWWHNDKEQDAKALLKLGTYLTNIGLRDIHPSSTKAAQLIIHELLTNKNRNIKIITKHLKTI